MNALATVPNATIHAASTQVPPDRTPQPSPVVRQRRGFAMLTPERRQEIASLGGRTAHAHGKAHEFTQQEAQAAGRKGGNAVSQDRAYMARIGRLGGSQRQENQRAKRSGTP